MTNAARLQIIVEADTAKAESGLQSLGQKVQSFGQSFAQGLGVGAGVAAFQAGIGLMTGSFGALKGSVIDFNQQLDQSRAVFARYFDGNTQVAEQFLNTLKGFAATTPFEFKDLSQLAIRLQNANTNANDIIPTIKAIGNAASASGSLGQESLGRITTALTQMQMKGKVTGEEMLQLVEAGVPAWNLLAEATGKPIPVLQEMASKGQLSADVMIAAFRGAYENVGLMEGASKSLEGALSTIRDVGTQAFADIGRSVFELATGGANALATFLSSEQFQAWANAARVGVESVVVGVRSLLESLAPVGQVIATAFGQLTSGDFSGAFATIGAGIQTALGTAVSAVQAFGQQMFGAGMNLVSELAGGILQGAQSVVQGAVDVVASTIAAFLVGNSPPPEGPLARVREGGANVIAAWGEGAASAADGAVKPAADKIAGGLDQLKDAGRGVDAAIRDIGKSIGDLDGRLNDVKARIDDVKDGYRDQLEPLEASLKAITQRTDYEAEEQALLMALEESALRRAENEAQGSREVRARLDDQIEELNLQKQAIQNAAKREDLDRKARGERSAAEQKLEGLRDAGKGRDENPRIRELQERLERMRDVGSGGTREKSAAERRLEGLRNAGRGGQRDTGLDDEKEALRVQEARLKLAEQRAKLDARAAKGEDVTFDRQQLDLDAKQLDLSIKEYAAKKAATAEEAKRQQEIAQLEATVRKEREDADRAEGARKKEIAGVEKELAAAKKQDQDAERGRQREIATLERQVRDEKRQAQMAEAERSRQLAGIDRQILDLNQQKADLVDKPRLAAIQDAQAELKERRSVFDTAQREDKLRRDMLALPIRQQIEGLKAEQAALLKPLEEQLEQLGRQKTELSEQRAQYQAIKGDIAAATAALKDQEKAAKEATANAPRPGVDKSFTPDAIAEQAIAKAKESGERLADQLKAGFVGWITQNPLISAGTLAGALFGAGQGAALGASLGSVVPVIGTSIGAVLGAGIGAAVGGLVVGNLAGLLQAKIEEIVGAPLAGALGERFASIGRQLREGDIPGLIGSIGSGLAAAVPVLAGKVAEWSNAFVDWAGATLPPLLDRLTGLVDGVLDWIGASAGPIADKLYDWSLAFVDWLGTAWLDMASEMADLAGRVLSWIGENATTIAGKLADWATAFVAWVGPRIPDLLSELGKLAARLIEWIGSNAGRLADGLGTWASEFVSWVGPKIPPLLAELGKLLLSVGTWMLTTALPAIVGKLTQWGIALVEWVAPRIPLLVVELGKLFERIRTWFFTEGIPGLFNFGIEIGKAAIDGLAKAIDEYRRVAYTAMQNWIDGMVAAVKGWLGIASPSTVFEGIGTAIVDGLAGGVQATWETVKGWFVGFGGLLVEAFSTYVGGPARWLWDIGANILQGVKDGWDALWTTGANGVGSVREWLTGFGESVVGAFVEYGGGPLRWIFDVGGKVLAGLKAGWDAAWEAGGQGVGSIRDWLGNFGGSVVGTIEGWLNQGQQFITRLKNIGGGILAQIQEGMSGKLEELEDWVTTNIGKKLPEWMQKLLGIKSPSTVFREIGENLILGLIVGMEARSGELLESAKKLMDFGDMGSGPGMSLIREIGEIAREIGGMDFARAAMAIASQETGGGTDMFEDTGTGRGPFQFSTPGQLDAWAKHLGVGLQEAGQIAIRKPLEATRWALEGYLGDVLRRGIAKGQTGADLAEYGQRFGQVSVTPEAVRTWYERLFPGLAEGGIALATPGGVLRRLAEGGRDEAVIPLPPDWRTPRPSEWMAPQSGGAIGPLQTIRIVIEQPSGREAEEIVVQGYTLGASRGRLPVLGGA